MRLDAVNTIIETLNKLTGEGAEFEFKICSSTFGGFLTMMNSEEFSEKKILFPVKEIFNNKSPIMISCKILRVFEVKLKK